MLSNKIWMAVSTSSISVINRLRFVLFSLVLVKNRNHFYEALEQVIQPPYLMGFLR